MKAIRWPSTSLPTRPTRPCSDSSITSSPRGRPRGSRTWLTPPSGWPSSATPPTRSPTLGFTRETDRRVGHLARKDGPRSPGGATVSRPESARQGLPPADSFALPTPDSDWEAEILPRPGGPVRPPVRQPVARPLRGRPVPRALAPRAGAGPPARLPSGSAAIPRSTASTTTTRCSSAVLAWSGPRTTTIGSSRSSERSSRANLTRRRGNTPFGSCTTASTRPSARSIPGPGPHHHADVAVPGRRGELRPGPLPGDGRDLHPLSLRGLPRAVVPRTLGRVPPPTGPAADGRLRQRLSGRRRRRLPQEPDAGRGPGRPGRRRRARAARSKTPRRRRLPDRQPAGEALRPDLRRGARRPTRRPCSTRIPRTSPRRGTLFGTPHWERVYALVGAGLMAGVPMDITYEEDVAAGWLLDGGQAARPDALPGRPDAAPAGAGRRAARHLPRGRRARSSPTPTAPSSPARPGSASRRHEIKAAAGRGLRGRLVRSRCCSRPSSGSAASWPRPSAATGRFPIDTDDPWVSKNLFDGGAIRYLMLASETSPYPWDAGTVWSLGALYNKTYLPKTVALTFPACQGVVYDVFDHAIVAPDVTGGRPRARVDLTTFPGRLYALAPARLGAPEVEVFVRLSGDAMNLRVEIVGEDRPASRRAGADPDPTDGRRHSGPGTHLRHRGQRHALPPPGHPSRQGMDPGRDRVARRPGEQNRHPWQPESRCPPDLSARRRASAREPNPRAAPRGQRLDHPGHGQSPGPHRAGNGRSGGGPEDHVGHRPDHWPDDGERGQAGRLSDGRNHRRPFREARRSWQRPDSVLLVARTIRPSHLGVDPRPRSGVLRARLRASGRPGARHRPARRRPRGIGQDRQGIRSLAHSEDNRPGSPQE